MEYKTYKIRWLLLTVMALAIAGRSYVSISFEAVNNVTSNYFRMSALDIDLLATINRVTGCMTCFVMAVAGDAFGIRLQSLTMALSMFVGCFLLTAAFINRNMYWMAVLGHIVTGVADGVNNVLSALFANAWFPPHEIATTFSLGFAVSAVAALLTTIVFTTLLPALPVDNNSGGNVTSSTENASNWVRTVFVLNFAIVTALMGIGTVILWIYMKDRPPSPPSQAEENIIILNDSHASGPAPFSLKLCYEAVKHFANPSFTLLNMANFLGSASLTLSGYLAPSAIQATFPHIDNKETGYALMLSCICAAAGAIVGGRVVDRFGRYKMFSIIGSLLAVLVCVGLYLGHLLKNLTTLFVLYPTLNFLRSFVYPALAEFLAEAIYPEKGVTATSMYFLFHNLGPFVFALLIRAAMVEWGVANAMAVPFAANALSLILVMFVKPNYKRTKVNTEEATVLDSKIISNEYATFKE